MTGKVATPRARYERLAAEPYGYLLKINAWLDQCELDAKLRRLVELRVSQINGCAFCCDMHARQARQAGESQQRLDVLAVWDESGVFTPAERAALAWAESLTHISQKRAPQTLYEQLAAYFNEQQIAELTLAVSVMNAWNRMAIGLAKPQPT